MSSIEKLSAPSVDDQAVNTLAVEDDQSLTCDYCGAITEDPWHTSGVLNGVVSRHIHSCDACYAANLSHCQSV